MRPPDSGVRFEQLGFAWPDGTAVFDRLDLDVAAAGITALIGPSGCGKSTALRLAAGLLQPTRGAVSGVEGSRAFVFQAPTLLPWRSVVDNVALPLELAGESDRRARAVDVLAQVGLADAVDKLPHELSGGMQMRASVARALVTRPALLCLDEPFGALDALTRRQLHAVFLDVWRATRPTVLLVTHDIDEAVFLADQVLVMDAEGGLAGRFVVDLPRPRTSAHRHAPALAALTLRLEEVLGA